jgi:hypothetical protein
LQWLPSPLRAAIHRVDTMTQTTPQAESASNAVLRPQADPTDRPVIAAMPSVTASHLSSPAVSQVNASVAAQLSAHCSDADVARAVKSSPEGSESNRRSRHSERAPLLSFRSYDSTHSFDRSPPECTPVVPTIRSQSLGAPKNLQGRNCNDPRGAASSNTVLYRPPSRMVTPMFPGMTTTEEPPQNSAFSGREGTRTSQSLSAVRQTSPQVKVLVATASGFSEHDKAANDGRSEQMLSTTTTSSKGRQQSSIPQVQCEQEGWNTDRMHTGRSEVPLVHCDQQVSAVPVINLEVSKFRERTEIMTADLRTHQEEDSCAQRDLGSLTIPSGHVVDQERFRTQLVFGPRPAPSSRSGLQDLDAGSLSSGPMNLKHGNSRIRSSSDARSLPRPCSPSRTLRSSSLESRRDRDGSVVVGFKEDYGKPSTAECEPWQRFLNSRRNQNVPQNARAPSSQSWAPAMSSTQTSTRLSSPRRLRSESLESRTDGDRVFVGFKEDRHRPPGRSRSISNSRSTLPPSFNSLSGVADLCHHGVPSEACKCSQASSWAPPKAEARAASALRSVQSWAPPPVATVVSCVSKHPQAQLPPLNRARVVEADACSSPRGRSTLRSPPRRPVMRRPIAARSAPTLKDASSDRQGRADLSNAAVAGGLLTNVGAWSANTWNSVVDEVYSKVEV